MRKLLYFFAAVICMAACQKAEDPSELPDTAELYLGTVSVDYEDSVYDNENIKVKLSEEEDGTMTLIIYRIKFVPKMPVTVTVTVKGIDFWKDGGKTFFAGDDIVPYSGIMPFSSRTVHQLEGTVDGEKLSFSLLFGDSPTRFEGVQLH